MGIFSKSSRQSPLPGRRRPVPSRSPSPQIYSYRSQRSEQFGTTGRQSFRDVVNADKASKAARYWLQRFGVLVVLVVVIISLASLLLVSPDPRILPLKSDQTAFLRPTDVYQQAAAKLFAGSLANRNKVTVNTTAIALSLKHEFPELSAVSITLPLVGHRPIVYIQPTTPALLLTTTQNQSFVIDQNGRALATGDQVANIGSLHLIPVKDESGVVVQAGQLALSSDTVAFIKSIEFQLAQQHIGISTLVLPSASSELDAYIAGQSYFVKFNLESGGADQQAGAYLAVRHQLAGEHITPREYIDVRIAGRAYYQ